MIKQRIEKSIEQFLVPSSPPESPLYEFDIINILEGQKVPSNEGGAESLWPTVAPAEEQQYRSAFKTEQKLVVDAGTRLKSNETSADGVPLGGGSATSTTVAYQDCLRRSGKEKGYPSLMVSDDLIVEEEMLESDHHEDQKKKEGAEVKKNAPASAPGIIKTAEVS